MIHVTERIGRYLSATPPAVSGHNGHGQTFKVACDLVHGWMMPAPCAVCWLRFYNQRCRPHWSAEEFGRGSKFKTPIIESTGSGGGI